MVSVGRLLDGSDINCSISASSVAASIEPSVLRVRHGELEYVNSAVPDDAE